MLSFSGWFWRFDFDGRFPRHPFSLWPWFMFRVGVSRLFVCGVPTSCACVCTAMRACFPLSPVRNRGDWIGCPCFYAGTSERRQGGRDS